MLLIRVLIRGYQWFVSPMLDWLAGGPGRGCRFEPTCSHYFLEATETHGVWRGAWLGLKRLARCHPWGGQGADPVPPRTFGERRFEAQSSKSEAIPGKPNGR